MRHILAALLVACSVFIVGCSSDTTMPVDSGTDADDITAQPIVEYEVVESYNCVGLRVLDEYAEYDYQCQEVAGDCVDMPNPRLGNTFYCALCGLKGSKKICFAINPE